MEEVGGTLGFPGVTVGTEVVGIPVDGAALEGSALGFPGVAVGP